MKKLFTILTILTAFAAKGQPYVSPELGWSTNKSIQVSMQIGYQFQGVQLEADLRTHIDRRSPALFGTRLGYEIPLGLWSLTPLAACYYKMVSTDKKSLNGFVIGTGLRLKAGNGATLQMSYAGGVYFFGIGFISN